MTQYADSDAVKRHIIRCIRAAYFVCRQDAPILLYPSLVRFLVDEGIPDMAGTESYRRYFSQYAMNEFIAALAQHLQDEQMRHIRESPWYGLSLDESTDRARGKHLIIYISYERNHEVVTQFLSLLPVERADAASLFTSLTTFLESRSLPLEKLVGIATDGASVMTGPQAGLVARLRQLCPWLVSTHCIAHR
ncbi:unnamed protein product [Closterium sp. NIES-54]